MKNIQIFINLIKLFLVILSMDIFTKILKSSNLLILGLVNKSIMDNGYLWRIMYHSLEIINHYKTKIYML